MQLLLNGKKMNCPCDHLEDLKAAYGSGQEITIVNGFATTENLALKEGDEIYFIPKDRLPPKEALEGMMCSRHTPKVHQKVSAGRVAICGLGGLGSNAAVYLARTGVGHLHLIDFDTVDASNLNRQSYMVRDLGQRKTDALARQIADINRRPHGLRPPYGRQRTDYPERRPGHLRSLRQSRCQDHARPHRLGTMSR